MKGNVQSNAMREFCLTCLTFQQVSLQGSDKIQSQLASDEGFQVIYVSVKGGFLRHTAPSYYRQVSRFSVDGVGGHSRA